MDSILSIMDKHHLSIISNPSSVLVAVGKYSLSSWVLEYRYRKENWQCQAEQCFCFVINQLIRITMETHL